MKFNHLLLAKLEPLFTKYNMHIVEQFENYLKLESKNLIIILVYNPNENSNTFWIGRNVCGADNVEISNTIMKDFFHSDLQIGLCTTDVFIENLRIFFEREGKSLLEGDVDQILALEKYDQENTHLYNLQLKNKQNLGAADKAWAETDYKNFIKFMDKIDKQHWSSSYKLKYKIAHERTKL